MRPLVSVLIPVYNSEKFLEECIYSVLKQTYDRIEVIAVNDGSTDQSLKILEKYSNKIKIITHNNQGLASSVNNGISRCNGKWIKWISPDDVMYPNCVEELIKNSDDNTIVYSNWDIIDEHSKPLRTFSESDYNSLKPFEFVVRLLNGQQINVNTTLIPTNLLNSCKIRTLSNPVALDYDFFLNAAMNFSTKFFLVKKPLIQYRIHSNQLSHKNIASTLSFIDDIKKEYLEKLDEKTKEKYIQALEEYNKNMPISKKTMEVGLNLLSKLPKEISDAILVFYLNQIRVNR